MPNTTTLPRVLVVDDNKTLTKLIGRKIQAAFNCELDLAFSLEEAKVLMDTNSYFISILDLCLPDAPYGEVVDFALEKGILSIVLTGLDDEETRKKFLDKDIVDYVLKTSDDCVRYIISSIERLLRNQKTKIIIAEDSAPTRATIKNMLKSQLFEVLAAGNGEEALSYLNDHPDTKLIITDKEMPIMGGEALLQEVRKLYDKTQLSVIVLTSYGSNEITAHMLKNGANDFIDKPFAKETLICRINNSLDIVFAIEKISNLANFDFLTGIANRRHFFELCEKIYEKKRSGHLSYLAVLMIDIDHFKLVNDRFGHDMGDCVIKFCAQSIASAIGPDDVVARFGGEEFCVFLSDTSKEAAFKLASTIRLLMRKSSVRAGKESVSFTVSIGMSFSNYAKNIEKLVQEADSALYDAKHLGRDRVEEFVHS